MTGVGGRNRHIPACDGYMRRHEDNAISCTTHKLVNRDHFFYHPIRSVGFRASWIETSRPTAGKQELPVTGDLILDSLP